MVRAARRPIIFGNCCLYRQRLLDPRTRIPAWLRCEWRLGTISLDKLMQLITKTPAKLLQLLSRAPALVSNFCPSPGNGLPHWQSRDSRSLFISVQRQLAEKLLDLEQPSLRRGRETASLNVGARAAEQRNCWAFPKLREWRGATETQDLSARPASESAIGAVSILSGWGGPGGPKTEKFCFWRQ